MSTEEKTQAELVASTLVVLRESAEAWQATANRYKGALLGERLIVLDVHERAYSQVMEGGESKYKLELPRPDLNGVLFMTRKNADLVKASMDAEVPQFGPFVVHDFQEYAQSKANESNDLVKKLAATVNSSSTELSGKVETDDTKLTETSPSPAQLEAIEAYRLKHGSNWKEKLSDAWASGRDDREPNGHLLRQVRNNFGPEWLEEYQSAPRVRTVEDDYGPSELVAAQNAKPEGTATRETVYQFPVGLGHEAGQTMWGRLNQHGFHPQWEDGVTGISLPIDEVSALRGLQTSTPRTWGNHPDVTKMLDEGKKASDEMVEVNRARLAKLTPEQRDWIETIHSQTGLHLGQALDLNDGLHELAAKHLKLCAIDVNDSGLTGEQESARDAIEQKVRELVEGVAGIKGAAFMYDPRGTTVALKFESGAQNSFFDGGSYKVPVNPAYVKSLADVPFWDAYVGNEKSEFVERLEQSGVADAAEVAERLQELATVYTKLREIQSNDGLSDAQTMAKDHLRELISESVDGIDGIKKIEFGSDPRYATVILHLESGRSNKMGGGWSVPVDQERLDELDDAGDFWDKYAVTREQLPAVWASALVNGDWDSLKFNEPEEAAKAKAWLDESGLRVLDCSEKPETVRVGGILTEVLTYSCVPLEHKADLENADPDYTGYVVLTIDNTANAAFVDLGRDQEIARIIGEAAAKFEDEESTHGGNFVLRDVNGNRVGEAKRVDEVLTEKVDEGTVRLSIGLGGAAFDEEDTGVEVARILRDAAKQVRDGNHNFPMRDSNGNSVGEFKFAEPKTLDVDASDDDCAPS